MYADDDLLQLSGIQHYRFCPRQWALIHIEQQWADNRLTAEGQALHQNVDDPFGRQREGGHIVLRALHIASHTLGLYGIADAVELHSVTSCDNNDAITLPNHQGWWRPLPVEYKHGRPKQGEEDAVQLAAEAICLEEMHHIRVPRGAIYYGQTRHRTIIDITDTLRAIVSDCAQDMHRIYATGRLPQATKSPKCRNCSLLDLCMPATSRLSTATTYLSNNLYT